MNAEERIAALEKRLQELTDRQEILDCIVRTSRGNDRFDIESISGAYHPDGLHELGRKLISGAEYGEHANHAHGAMCEANLHNVTMHSCEIDGDVAHAESYIIGLLLDKGCRTSATALRWGNGRRLCAKARCATPIYAQRTISRAGPAQGRISCNSGA